MLKSEKPFFVNQTGMVDRQYLKLFNAKALEFQKIDVECTGIFVSYDWLSSPNFRQKFDTKDKKNIKDKSIFIAVNLIHKRRGRSSYTKHDVQVIIGKGLEDRLSDAIINRFLEVTVRSAGDEWQYGLQLFLQKTYLYLQNSNSDEYTKVNFKEDPLRIIGGLFLIVGFLCILLRGVFPRYLE